jgi:hypothetical protein
MHGHDAEGRSARPRRGEKHALVQRVSRRWHCPNLNPDAGPSHAEAWRHQSAPVSRIIHRRSRVAVCNGGCGGSRSRPGARIAWASIVRDALALATPERADPRRDDHRGCQKCAHALIMADHLAGRHHDPCHASTRQPSKLGQCRDFPCWVASSGLALCRASRPVGPPGAAGFCFCRFPREGAPRQMHPAVGRSSGRPRRANNPARKLAMNTTTHSPPSSPSLNPLCLACGKYHGSVGVEFHCLRAALRSARAALKAHAEAALHTQPATDPKPHAPSTATSSSSRSRNHGCP